jgi:hypothetical protein
MDSLPNVVHSAAKTDEENVRYLKRSKLKQLNVTLAGQGKYDKWVYRFPYHYGDAQNLPS